jgi:hypothetical protein
MARAHAYTTPGPKSRSRQTPRTSTGGPCLGARGKQAQLAQANGSKFNLLLMLVAQMSTHPRVIATRYCSWGSRKFKLTHGALTAFEDLGVVAVAVPRRARRCFSARLRRPPTRHRNRGRLLLQTCDHSISQAFNGAAARGEAHLARIPDPFEAPRAKTIGSTTNIAIGEAHLALFVMWCPGGARSMFRTVSEIRAVKWSNHVKLALPRCGSAGSGRDEPAPPRFLLSRE